MRVVLDTNQILAAGTAWLHGGVAASADNVARRVLIRVATDHTGLYCGKIAGEYFEKLCDGPHTVDRVKAMMVLVLGSFTRVAIMTKHAPTAPADPDDEVFLLCAIDGQADYLVTEDGHLLDVKGAYQQPVIGRPKEFAPILGA